MSFWGAWWGAAAWHAQCYVLCLALAPVPGATASAEPSYRWRCSCRDLCSHVPDLPPDLLVCGCVRHVWAGGVLSPGKPLTYTPPPSFVLTVNLVRHHPTSGAVLVPRVTWPNTVLPDSPAAQAALVCDEAGSRAPHRVCVETAHDDSVRRKLVLCTLRPGRVEQQRLDLLFGWDHEATWSVEGGSGSVHLTGYLSAVEAGDVAVGSGPASADMMALAHGAVRAAALGSCLSALADVDLVGCHVIP